MYIDEILARKVFDGKGNLTLEIGCTENFSHIGGNPAVVMDMATARAAVSHFDREIGNDKLAGIAFSGEGVSRGTK